MGYLRRSRAILHTLVKSARKRLDPRLLRVAVGRQPPNYPLGENHTSGAFILKNLYSVAVRMVGSARPMTLIQWSTPRTLRMITYITRPRFTLAPRAAFVENIS
jgi:hypothetical protein